jgi:photosystem II stability/assembly factor-like uncharacterized protein
MFSTQSKLLSVSLLALLLLSSCSETNASSVVTGGDSAQASVQAGGKMGGVHDLVLTEEGLLMGTHNGVWIQVGTETPARVGDSRFDAMALSGYSGGLIASGHPDSSEEQVGSLGLRKSSDGGATWASVSLYGVADFHRLRASGASIIGLASGSLVRSDDSGVTWLELPNPNIFDFAMNPTSSNEIVASTEAGLISSSDGGQSFSTISDAPFLALLSWGSNRLAGVSPTGAVYNSMDNGKTWQEAGNVPGGPRAFSSLGDEMTILAEGAIYYSKDAGENFTERIAGVPGH